jgi:N6-adenosine-specific RNA methylase IME4
MRTPLVQPRYRMLVADPPWKFGDKLPGAKRGAANNYACLSVEEIEGFPLRAGVPWPHMLTDSILLLWRVASMQEEALRVVRAWGFVLKSELVWCKQTPAGKPWFGMGRYVRNAHETCLIACRGKGASLIRDHSIRSTFAAPVGAHSSKPDAFYAIAERLCEGPRLELFARVRRPGWTQHGAELQ